MILSRKLLIRYRELKQHVPDCLLLMQVGAFMQVMGDDARIVSQVTGLTLQMAGASALQPGVPLPRLPAVPSAQAPHP